MQDLETFEDYHGREQSLEDRVTEVPLHNLAAMLDEELSVIAPYGVLPPLGHWAYFVGWPRQSRLGSDGHELRGGFLPPIALPRRMLAGVRLRFERPLRLGDTIRKRSRIDSITPKQGRSGPLYFVTVSHEISGPDGVAIHEEQTIVYRDMAPPGTASETAPDVDKTFPEAEAAYRFEPDPILLFRFSSITGNSHRIHYDRSYAMETEGYPGLVVHGPLQAMLLLDCLRRYLDDPLSNLREYSFQSRSPLFDTAGFNAVIDARNGDTFTLSTCDAAGNTCTTAEAVVALPA